MTFHDGEIAVQTRSGVRSEAQLLAPLLHSQLQPAAVEFLQRQTLAIASTIASDGSLWASLLAAPQPLITVVDPHTIEIPAIAPSTDLLIQNLQHSTQIGLLAIDLANRKRLRINGQAKSSEAGLTITVKQAFFNCPKYIQTRHLEQGWDELESSEARYKTGLDMGDRSWIRNADTFFIASAHADQGCDASHRGGYPGFVQVMGNRQLVFPDYAGNNMFQTFGNLSLNPNAGLLFVDFDQGHTLQLSGKATLIWDETRCQAFPGAQRLVEFSVEQVLETRYATPLRWQFGTYSPALLSQKPGARVGAIANH